MPENLSVARLKAFHQEDHIRICALKAVIQVHCYREKANQHDYNESGGQSETHKQDDHRCYNHDRYGLTGYDERVENFLDDPDSVHHKRNKKSCRYTQCQSRSTYPRRCRKVGQYVAEVSVESNEYC